MKTIVSGGDKAKIVALMLLCAQFTISALPALAASVRVSGQQVLNVNAAAGGLSAAQRADKIQQNLDNALVAANNRAPSAVSVVYVKGQPVITLGGYYVVTVDAASAKAAGTTPAVLSEKWAKSLRAALSNKASVDSYVAHLTGSNSEPSSGAPAASTSSPNTASAGATTPSYGSTHSPTVHRGRVAYIPAGMTIPVKLTTSLVSSAAKAGDLIEAKTSEAIHLGDASIPAGTIVSGHVVETKAAQRLAKSGTISVKFNSLRTPDGIVTPISAHIVSGVEKTSGAGDVIKGESLKDKVKRTAISGAIGAGGGAVLGTAIGAIAGSGRGAGKGAWSGLAIGAGLGVAESLLVRKGAEVKLVQGTPITLQLDSAASVAASTTGLF
ncbi:MAG: hypothetical protein K2W95_33670 [Candidatus Obscuribacterales bacterium]|nr:hypothetical protein [Candidatus Obscuribacterales bacterium]